MGEETHIMDDLFSGIVQRKPAKATRKLFWQDADWNVISRHYTTLEAMNNIPSADGEYDLCTRERHTIYCQLTVIRKNGKTYERNPHGLNEPDELIEFTVDENGFRNSVD